MSKQYVSDKGYFDGRRRYRAGEPFTLKGKKPGRGMTPVDGPAKAPRKSAAKAKAPDTLSEMGQQQAKADAEARKRKSADDLV